MTMTTRKGTLLMFSAPTIIPTWGDFTPAEAFSGEFEHPETETLEGCLRRMRTTRSIDTGVTYNTITYIPADGSAPITVRN